MKENAFSRLVKKQLEDQGAFVYNITGNQYSAAGVPDLHVTHASWTGYIELKVGKNKLSALQRLTIKKIKRAGGKALVLRAPDILENEEGERIADSVLACLL